MNKINVNVFIQHSWVDRLYYNKRYSHENLLEHFTFVTSQEKTSIVLTSDFGHSMIYKSARKDTEDSH